MHTVLTTKREADFLVCEHCNGTGELENGKCRVCNGFGVVAFLEDKILYWGKKLDKGQIYFEKALKVVRAIFNLFLLVIGLSGLGMLFFVSYQDNFTNLFSLDFWTTVSADRAYFWFSLLVLFYIFYRLESDTTGKRPVFVHCYSKHNRLYSTWEDVLRQPKTRFVDVAKSLDEDTDRAFAKSYVLASNWAQKQITRLHLFAELLTCRDAAMVAARLGLDAEKIEDKLARVLLRDGTGQIKNTVLSAEAKKIALTAYVDAHYFGEARVSALNIFNALLNKTVGDDLVADILLDFNVKQQDARNVIQWIRILEKIRQRWGKFKSRARYKPKKGMDRAMTAVATPILNSVSEDLTLAAINGRLFPCLGRDKEFEEIFRIMEGSRKPVLLVGNQGVGRTSIIYGLAQKMAEETVPEILQDKRLVSVSVPHLLAGDQHTTTEQKLLMIAQELIRAGNVVLVVESIHNLANAQAGNASLGLGDILAQFLERGAFYAIATTTAQEFKTQIEGTALAEQFQVVRVNEMEINDAIQILEVKSSTIEYDNNVFFSYQAIAKAAELAAKYLHETHLPENALSVLEQAATMVRRTRGEKTMVSAEDIAAVLSEKTNIPLTAVTESESEKLLNLEERLHERVIGQNEAVKMVANSLRHARAELRDEKRPIASLLFVGPTGVGKTELAAAVAEIYFGKEENMVRLDMSEFQEATSVFRFLGAPAGAATYKSGGYLTEAIRKKPFSLLLVDEIEKAHPDILNLFLQIMEDGRLTDNMGRTVSFANTIIIMTSNASADFVQAALLEGRTIDEIKKVLINEKLKAYFKPEFMNRLDGLVVFAPLSREDLVEVARLLVAKVAKQLETRGITLKITDAGLAEFAEHGYDVVFGARPLRRLIQEKIDD
ncbi:AAA family ATPase, partial [Candidatus Falkowbacteria bacterium]|nr:AAA family ATPase [Candidatus Falkowbacteria bacterium]